MQADADWAIKLIGVNVLSPDSVIARNRLGFSKSEQAIIERENREREAKMRAEEQRKARQGIQNQIELAKGTASVGGGVPSTNGKPPGGAGANGKGPSGGGAKPRPSGGRVPNQRDYARG